MKSTGYRFAAVLLVAVMSLQATLFNADIARAQCASVSVTNQTGCSVNLCLYDAFTGTVVCQVIAAGAMNVPFALPGSFIIGGVRTPAGNNYAFPPQPPTPACTPCILMSPSVDTCCARVCFNKITCRIGILPCAFPCPL